jgi:hypothetical protein
MRAFLFYRNEVVYESYENHNRHSGDRSDHGIRRCRGGIPKVNDEE